MDEIINAFMNKSEFVTTYNANVSMYNKIKSLDKLSEHLVPLIDVILTLTIIADTLNYNLDDNIFFKISIN